MEWTAIAGGVGAIAGGVGATFSVANVLISWKSKGDIAELKLSVTEKLTETERGVRAWTEAEFARKETVQAQLEALKASR